MSVEIKYNPFDHMNAVTDPALFIGREQELAEFSYYFEQSKLAPRAFHLAVLGERGSGKTSLLNMAENIAREGGFCVARVNLNERNVSTPLQFLFKVFNSIIEAAVVLKCPAPEGGEVECLGGRSGDIYNTYIDTITAFNVPPPEKRVFTFPIQYAVAMAAGREDSPIVEDAFQADLQKISKEVKRPIALLFDECNLLADKRADLQMLRNTFMNTTGYMLVLSGTSEMFPIMSDVFSPIARQFKKIELAPFTHKIETKRAISVPLKQIGLEPGLSQMRRISPGELDDIHRLTGGKPHEIQLVCHCIIRQIQNGKKDGISLDVDVLDDVLLELRKGIDLSSRPIIWAIRQLSEKDINDLAVFMQAADATLEQYEFVETAFRIAGRPKLNKKALQRAIEAEIFRIEDEKIIFNGDDFDRVYCRYYASRRGAKIYFNFVPVEDYFGNRLLEYLAEHARLDFLGPCDPDRPAVIVMGQGVTSSEETQRERRLHPITVRRLFFANFEAAHCGVKTIPNYTVTVKYKGLAIGAMLIPVEIRKFDASAAEVAFHNLKQRLEILGAALWCRNSEVETLTLEEVNDAIKGFLSETPETDWEQETEREFFSSFTDVYAERHDVALAKAYADALVVAFNRTPPELANNIGYFYLAISELSKASAYLQHAADVAESDNDRRLIAYNSSVLSLQQNKVEEAREHVESAKLINKGHPPEKALCLLIPEIRNKAVVLQERWNPKYTEAFKAFDQLFSKVDEGLINVDAPVEVILQTESPA